MRKAKTIYEYFNDYSKEEIDNMLELLDDSDKALLFERYGNDLDSLVIKRLNPEISNKFYAVLVPKMRRILWINSKKNEGTNVEVIDENVFEDNEKCEKLSNILRASRFNKILNKFSTREISVVLLKLGYIDGKCYSNNAISKILNISVEEIIQITEMVLKLYKDDLVQLMDNYLLINSDDFKKIRK